MKNTFEKIADIKNLYSAWEKIKILSKEDYIYNSYDVEFFSENIDNILIVLNHELLSNKFKFDNFHKFDVPKKDNGIRVFHINTLKNMIVSQAILNIVGPAFEKKMIDESFGYRLDLLSSTCVYKEWSLQYERFSGTLSKWYENYCDQDYVILRYDIRGFFDNISIDKLSNTISNILDDNRVCELLNDYFCTNTINEIDKREVGLPQGIHTSGFFANIYLDKFDKAIKSRTKGYVRYVDDLFILIDNTVKSDLYTLVDKELSSLGLSPNYSKYNEVMIADYAKLSNIINEIKYDSIQFIEAQADQLTKEEKDHYFEYIEQKLSEKKDISRNDLKDFTEHINYLLFLNRKLDQGDDILFFALEVLKNEAIKYNKLEKVYFNLFTNDLAKNALLEKIDDYPHYIKLSLAKFLLSNREYSYDSDFVNTYISSSDYLLITFGLLLATNINSDFNISEILDKVNDVQKQSFILKYILTCFIYEGKDFINETVVDKYFTLKADEFLAYLFHFTHINFCLNLYEIDVDSNIENEITRYFIEDNRFSLIFLIKILFYTSDYSLYRYFIENLKSDLTLRLAKQEILSNLYLPEENENCNIEKLIKLYKEILVYTDEWSEKIHNELKNYINDFQKTRNRVYIRFEGDKYPLIEDIRYESKITRLFIEVNDIEYLQVIYKDKKYILEKINKGVFRDKSDYNKYINQLTELKKNNLTVDFIELVNYTDDYKYIYILYEIEDFDKLLWNTLKVGEHVDICRFEDILTQLDKLNKIVKDISSVSSYNVLIANNTIKFICILPQIRSAVFLSCNNIRKDIIINRSIESFGYLLIENYYPKDFIDVSRRKIYEVEFELPHINAILNKIFTNDRDLIYKQLIYLIDDIKKMIEFYHFINSLKKSKEKEINRIIAYDFLGFKTLQHKRYIDCLESDVLCVISESFEGIIKKFYTYLENQNIALKKYSFLKKLYTAKLKSKKVNIYSISVIKAILVLYKDSSNLINKYKDRYDFKGFTLFLGFMLETLGYKFELETRYRYDNEVAASAIVINPQISINSEFKKVNAMGPCFQELWGDENSDGSDFSEYNSLISRLDRIINDFGTSKVKSRCYGKLFLSGITLSNDNKKDINMSIRKWLIKKKEVVKVDNIDNFHKYHIRVSCNPHASLEYLNGTVLNVNIESINAKKLFVLKKSYERFMITMKEVLNAIKWILLVSSGFGILVYFLSGSKTNGIWAAIGTVIINILSVIFKDLITASLNSLKRIMKIG